MRYEVIKSHVFYWMVLQEDRDNLQTVWCFPRGQLPSDQRVSASDVRWQLYEDVTKPYMQFKSQRYLNIQSFVNSVSLLVKHNKRLIGLLSAKIK